MHRNVFSVANISEKVISNFKISWPKANCHCGRRLRGWGEHTRGDVPLLLWGLGGLPQENFEI